MIFFKLDYSKGIDKRPSHLRYKGGRGISGRENRRSKVEEMGIDMVHKRNGNSPVSEVLEDSRRR